MNILQYDHQAFQRLPGFSEAGSTFDHLDGHEIVNKVLMPLFRKHGVEYTVGATLAHGHFDLTEYERLVEYKDTSVPWQANAAELVPNCWLFEGDSIRPYEIKYEKRSSVEWADDKIQQFLVAFQSELEKLGAKGLFGLCGYPGNKFRGRVELTKGRANINFDPEDVSWRKSHWRMEY
jgi:hypothetical protein